MDSVGSDRPPIWVADSNLFGYGFNRRYLFGLAARTGVPLAVPEALTAPEELPAQIARPMAHAVRNRLRRQGVPDDDTRTAAARAMLAAMPVVEDRLRAWRRDGALRVLESGAESRQLVREFVAENPASGRDAATIAETVASGGEFIATNNVRSIDHDWINRWWGQRTGTNEKLLVRLPELSQAIMPNPRAEAALALAMSLPAPSSDDKPGPPCAMQAFAECAERLPRQMGADAGSIDLARRIEVELAALDECPGLFDAAAAFAEDVRIEAMRERERELRRAVGAAIRGELERSGVAQ